ncbi:MAG: DNA polymerase III subunit delta [Erysipelotrichaceae bacterium]|nr:DNA polymerase III subunit delta [Erysipelotrichaceae bacterium]
MNILIYGQEGYLCRKKLNELLPKEGEVLSYDAQDASFSMEEVLVQANMFSLFADRKTIVIYNPFFLEKKIEKARFGISEGTAEEFLKYLANPNPDCDLIMYAAGITPAPVKEAVWFGHNWSKVFKDNVRKYECKPVDDKEFSFMTREMLKEKNVNITSSALNKLLEYVPNDLLKMSNEVEKLSLYGGKVDDEVIESLVYRHFEDNIFTLTGYILKKQRKQAFAMWRDFEKRKIPSQVVMGSLASSVRASYEVKVMYRNGYSQDETAKALNMSNGRVWHVAEDSKAYTEARLLEVLNEIVEVKKSHIESGMDESLAMELFLVNIMR